MDQMNFGYYFFDFACLCVTRGVGGKVISSFSSIPRIKDIIVFLGMDLSCTQEILRRAMWGFLHLFTHFPKWQPKKKKKRIYYIQCIACRDVIKFEFCLYSFKIKALKADESQDRIMFHSTKNSRQCNMLPWSIKRIYDI